MILKLPLSDFYGEASPAMDIVAELLSLLSVSSHNHISSFPSLWSLAKLTPSPKILSKELSSGPGHLKSKASFDLQRSRVLTVRGISFS